jgi:ABC-type uncharacterized transport system involved in gliding motility auxiliary subunit
VSTASRSAFGRLGLVALAALFIVAVVLSGTILRGARLDLTQNQLYTLAPGTTKVLGSIAEPINVYFFYSDKATGEIPYLRAYAGRIRDMLREFAQYSNGKLTVTEIDPIPFSDDEDRATQFGLQGIRLEGAVDPVFMGVAGTNSTGDDEVLAFLDPAKEAFLEYDLAKLVYTLANPKRPVVALLSSLPLNAGFDPMTQQLRQPWAITNQLRQLFELRQLEPTVTQIADDVQVLMVVHPKSLSGATLYAIDQFILRGGRAMLFVDPWCEADPGAGGDPSNPMSMAGGRSSELDALFKPWGLNVGTTQFIGDDRFALQVMGPQGQPVRDLGLAGIDATGLDQEDVVTAGLSLVNLSYGAALSVAPEAAAKLTPLIRSSDLAGPVGTSALGFMSDPSLLRADFKATGERYVLAARVTGKVSSAFPDGPPPGAVAGKQPHLAAAAESINVVVVGDVDVLSDRLWVRTQDFFGQRLASAFANNGDFVISALDNLLGSSDLIGLRARATFTRPFTRVEDLRRGAEDRFRQTEERLKQELADTERKLAELQANRDDRNAMIMSPEQQQEIAGFTGKRVSIRRELRDVQRTLDADIESLGNWLKIINIGLVPALISLLSVALLLLRRRQRSNPAGAGA